MAPPSPGWFWKVVFRAAQAHASCGARANFYGSESNCAAVCEVSPCAFWPDPCQRWSGFAFLCTDWQNGRYLSLIWVTGTSALASLFWPKNLQKTNNTHYVTYSHQYKLCWLQISFKLISPAGASIGPALQLENQPSLILLLLLVWFGAVSVLLIQTPNNRNKSTQIDSLFDWNSMQFHNIQGTEHNAKLVCW